MGVAAHQSSARELGRIRILYGLWLFVIFAYFVPASTWNPVSRYALSRALVEQHTLHIDAFAAATGDRAHFRGAYFSDKAPLPALVAAVPYLAFFQFERARGATARFHVETSDSSWRLFANAAFTRGLYVCSVSTAAVAGALLGVLLFELLRRRAPLPVALGISMVTVLSTPLFAYATSFYGHTIAATLLVAALLCAEVDGASLPFRRGAVAGACLAAAVGCEYLTALPGAVLAIYVASRAPSFWRGLGAVIAGAALPVLVICCYQTLCFGAPWRTGYAFIERREFAAGHASGLFGIGIPSPSAAYGLLFGANRGLFVVAPILLPAAVAGAVYTVRTRDPLARAAATAALLLFLANAGYFMWNGGAATGPRHLVPVLPLLGLGLVPAWSLARLRPLLVVLALASLANIVALVTVGIEAPETGNILFDYAWPRLLQGKIAELTGASNLGLDLGLYSTTSLGPVLVWMLLGMRALLRRAARFDAQAPRQSTVRGASLAAC